MDKLKINLIPPEVKERAKKEAKRTFGIRISIALLGALILVTLGILVIIIFQSVTIQSLNTQIEQEKANIGALKDKEAIVFFLKNRLDSIGKFGEASYQQGEFFALIYSLIPENVELTSIQVDKSEKVIFQGETNFSESLGNLFNNLTDPEINEGKIVSVAVESLSRAPNGTIRFNLAINMKEKASQ